MNNWKWMGKLCSLTPWTKEWSLKLYYKVKTEKYRHQYGAACKVQPHTVVFEAFMGKKYACSPKALYEAMLRDPYYASWEKIWAFRNPEAYRFLEKNANTRVVEYRKRDYYQAYARAGYWITNSRLPREVVPKQEQEYIQCWHGTPLKKLGFDLEFYAENKGNLKEVRENYLGEAKKFTRMPSPSSFYTEKMISAFHLEALGKENIFLERGYPRNDRLYLASEEEIANLRKQLQIPEGKRVILYAPTWRENQHVPGEGYRYQLQVDFHEWKKRLGEEYVVLFRAHYFISNQFDFDEYDGFIINVSDLDDVNDLYLVSDVLITDYSSVFFDYAILERPMLFYMYDYDAYKNKMRDFYLDIHMLPGPVVKTQEELLKNLENLPVLVENYKEKYQKFNETFNPHKGACSAEYLKEWVRE